VRDFVRLRTPAAVRDFTRGQWRTDHFRESAWIADLVDRFAARPRLFFRYTWPDVEWSHFTTWMHAIALRDYDAPAISDLYLLHELWHVVTHTDDPTADFGAWYRKMTTLEFEASLASEVLAYFHMPGLRADSFGFGIWADRFLDGPLTPDRQAHIAAERIRAMRDPDPFDFAEQQIAAYARQNFRWASVWKDRWREVEAAGRRLTETGDLDAHVDWLEARMAPRGRFGASLPDRVPFPEEAVTFAAIVAENRKVAGNPG
jgi:hypothetical protein